MTILRHDIEAELHAHPRALAVLALQYQAFKPLPVAVVTPANDGLSFSSRLRMLMGECVAIFVAASGVLAVLAIVYLMSMMVRGIRALSRR